MSQRKFYVLPSHMRDQMILSGRELRIVQQAHHVASGYERLGGLDNGEIAHELRRALRLEHRSAA